MWRSFRQFVSQLVNYWRTARDWLADAYQRTMDDLEHVIETPVDENEKQFDLTSEPIRHVVDHQNVPEQSFPSWKFWLTGLAVVALWTAVYFASNLLFLIWAAFIIAMALENMILFFANKMSRGWGIAFAYLTFLVFLLSGVLLVVPFIVTQAIDLWSLLLENVVSMQRALQVEGIESIVLSSWLPEFIKEWVLEWVEDGWWIVTLIQESILNNLEQIVTVWSSSLRDAGSIIVNFLWGFFSAAVQMAIVLVLSVFFSIEKGAVVRTIGSISWHTTRIELLMMKLYRRLGYWLKGQLILCVSIGVMVFTGLQLLALFWYDLPNKVTLSLIAWLTEFIPYAWPILWMIPALLVAGIEYGFGGAVWVAVLYIIIQQLENNVLVPMVMSQTLGASPLLIFICMIIWGSLLWFLWVLLAVPIAVIITIIYESFIQLPSHEHLQTPEVMTPNQ